MATWRLDWRKKMNISRTRRHTSTHSHELSQKSTARAPSGPEAPAAGTAATVCHATAAPTLAKAATAALLAAVAAREAASTCRRPATPSTRIARATRTAARSAAPLREPTVDEARLGPLGLTQVLLLHFWGNTRLQTVGLPLCDASPRRC